MQQLSARILACESTGADLALMVLEAPGIASCVEPGQFVMVQCGELPLRRPLSVHAASDERLALLWRIKGKGTEWLSRLDEGALVELTGPLGHGYTAPSGRSRVLIVAGGIGIAPLVFLASRLAASHDVVLVQGARCSDALYEPPPILRTLLPSVAACDWVRKVKATDDGSLGLLGSACDAALPHLEWADRVYLCGPVEMCSAAYSMAHKDPCGETPSGSNGEAPQFLAKLADAEVSVEQHMGCGVGACYCCSIATLHGRRKVCTDGPVFRLGDIRWDEVVL
jgi:dihydroorotate dehydrogenase electron transfer subunit